LIGKTIGKYQIQELLGRGGMGSIYRASHPTLDRDVAIKLIHLDKATDPHMAERFRREARVVAALRHAGIVQIYDFDIEADMLYMVMEYVPGESLAQRLDGIQAQGGRLPLDEALRLFKAIAEAAAYAHRQGVVHCDLKPGNVLLSTTGLPILTDFGISKFISGQRLTVTGDIMGTPHYMAPEQAAGGNVSTHTDVYGLGVILYELVTGVLPFNGDTSMSIAFKHVYEAPPPPRRLNPEISPALEQVILTAIAKAPTDRYPTARELLTALEAATVSSAPQLACVFICYNPAVDADRRLAAHLQQTLTALGHRMCQDTGQEPDPAESEKLIEESDLVVVLLSELSAAGSHLKDEVTLAYEYQKTQGKPRLLAVRLAYSGLLPYLVPVIQEPVRHVDWHSEADNPRVLQEIVAGQAGQAPPITAPAAPAPSYETSLVSEDGRLIALGQTSAPPLPAFDPRVFKEMIVPGGAVKLRDKFYIERPADAQLKAQMTQWGTTTTIRAPRQTGKTSVLMRGIHSARQQGARVVFQDFQSFGADELESLDSFLQELAISICEELGLAENIVDEAWEGSRSPSKKLTRFMEKHILPQFEVPVVLAMDEADSLLQADFYKDFFGLLRSWHNRRASRVVWEKLNLVLVISTEPYLLIDDIHQSPFNVGLHLGLQDFTETQVIDLNLRHGAPLNHAELPQMLALLNGHPYLTRLALYTMVTQKIPWAALQQQAPLDNGPFGEHLRHQYRILSDKPALKNALKDIISHNCCPDEKSLFRLLQAGLIKGSGDIYACRCDLYRHYFEDKLL
jgi:serine/threonine protein kinase